MLEKLGESSTALARKFLLLVSHNYLHALNCSLDVVLCWHLSCLCIASTECKISLLCSPAIDISLIICDTCAADHMLRFTRPSHSIFTYCKRSKSGAGEGLGMRLVKVAVSFGDSIPTCISKQMFTVSRFSPSSSNHMISIELLRRMEPSLVIVCTTSMKLTPTFLTTRLKTHCSKYS